jgi:hypothetical protein
MADLLSLKIGWCLASECHVAGPSKGNSFMGVELIDVRKELPKPSRKRESVIMSTPEWQEAIAKIEAGLRAHAGLKLVLSPKTLSKLGKYGRFASRTLKIQLKKYVQERKLDLAVFYRGSQDGQPVIWVTHEKEK